jgi:TonB family protein
MTRQSVSHGQRIAHVALAAFATLAIGSVPAFAAPPSPKPGTQSPSIPPTATGSLDKELIRGTIRQHIAEVKHCYEMGLIKKSGLQGRVMIEFAIGLDGKVSSASVASTTINDAVTEECIRKAVTTWVFPRPQGGIVKVTYPFMLKPEEAKKG